MNSKLLAKLIREEVRKVLLEGAVFKQGDRVKPLVGPHKGATHEVIAVIPNPDQPGEFTYNIRPLGLRPAQIKYRLGAAGAKAAELQAA